MAHLRVAYSPVLPHTLYAKGILGIHLLLEIFINGFQQGSFPVKVWWFPTHLGVPLVIVEAVTRLRLFY